MATEVIQRYELGELIGVGAAGAVFRAVDRETGEVLALKKLNPQAQSDRMIRDRFRREINIIQRLRHPNIIAYHGCNDSASELYYSMELVQGGTVKTLLDTGGALPWPVVVDLGIQLCSALQCAHNNGVIHRDLKPGNLFLTLDGQLKLGDFGIARDLTRNDLTQKGQMVGTHAYMAPEQIRGEQSVSTKADLYAMGCCLFEMLTHRKLFRGDSHRELYDQHLQAVPPHVRDFRPDCPAELDSLVDQLLCKSPDDRPFNARQVQASLLKIAVDNADQVFAKSEQPDSDSPAADTEPGSVLAGNLDNRLESDRKERWRQKSRQVLVERIRNPHLGAPQDAVSWSRLIAVAVVVLIFAAAAYAFKA